MNKKQIAITTEEWLKLPRSERVPRKWYWLTGWYEAPFAMMMNDWDNWEKHIKQEYPIQHWLRENFQYTFRHYYRTIKGLKRYIINPRRRMRNAVFSAQYMDLVDLVPHFHFQAIIEFVEVERTFETAEWTGEGVIEKGKKLKELYHYIKYERPFLLEKLSMAYEQVEITDISDQARYDRVDAIDKEVKDRDTELCIWVIQNRDLLWT
jgi:hypothetical protein